MLISKHTQKQNPELINIKFHHNIAQIAANRSRFHFRYGGISVLLYHVGVAFGRVGRSLRKTLLAWAVGYSVEYENEEDAVG
jgi:hypothetical protein